LAPPGIKKEEEPNLGAGDTSIYAGLIEDSPVGMILLGVDLSISYANRACSVLLAEENSVLIGLDLFDRVHPDDRDSLRFQIARHRLSGRTVPSVDIRFLRSDGRDLWMVVNISSTKAIQAAGELMLSIADIDERKRVDVEKRMLEERWNSALVSSTLGVWDHNFKTGVFYYSDTWKLLRGLRPDEEVETDTDDWIQSVHPDDRANVLEWIRKQIDGEIEFATFEYRERRKDGKWVWIECRGSSIEWDDNGKPTRIVGTDVDVTDRKATEEMLAHLSRRLELALNVTEIGVFEADLTDGTLLLDDRLLAMMDMTGEPSLQGATDWEYVIHPDDRRKMKNQVDSHVDVGSGFGNQFRIIRKDGSIRHIRARAAPFEDNSGHSKYIGVNWDVTDDVTIREELERAKTLAEARNRELEATKAKIEHNALHDFLTDLPNRRYLDEKLASRDPDRHGLAILHIDLDRFKQINDTLGHLAGDFMLLYAAKVLRESVGPDEFVARIGGDEFVILADFDGANEKLAQLADRIIRRMREPVQFNGTACRIGASIGIAFDCQPNVDAKQLLLNADIALYRAKSRGRNRCEFFSVDIQHQVINNKRVSDEILVALEKQEFVPHYQLQFAAATLDIAGAETLARWHHPDKGILGPNAFLNIAEDLDVVAAIDGMIFEKALKDFDFWRENGISIPKFSANVSSRRLYDPNLAAKLSVLPITPGTISFELLESIFLDDCDEAVLANLQTIRKMGIGIEIDDFGTGHASIVSLLKIGPGILKIDRELVMPITETLEQRNLVGSIIEIGKSLNIKVVAEGVETWDHIRILQDLGCDILQGYALARPLPFADIEPFVREQKWRKSDIKRSSAIA
jgi:diguanylate cyclase (GGDEF)-like protein/PAS domain S-box-containing protein